MKKNQMALSRVRRRFTEKAGVEAALATRSIQEQVYQSIFLGDTTFQFNPLSEHPTVAYTPNFYGIG